MSEMVSSTKLAEELGLSHKKIQGLILKGKMSVTPVGLQKVPGVEKPMRVCIIDRETFYSSLHTTKTSRKKKKKGK